MTTQAVQKRPSTSQKEGVCASQIQCPRQGRLKPHTSLTEPAGKLCRFLKSKARQFPVGNAARHPHQIVEILLETVGIRQHVGRRLVHGTQVSRVPCVAATHVARGRLDDKNRASGLGRGYGSTKPGIAGADHKNVPKPRKAIVGLCIHMYAGT